MSTIHHIPGQTYHGRRGDTKNAFRYSIDYVLLDAEAPAAGPSFFARNGRGVASVWDTDHGGPPKEGRGPKWVRAVLRTHDLPDPARIELLTQPRLLGHVFNPVSFWLCWDDQSALRVVIAEVNNTFGDRHSYLCHTDNAGPITADRELHARKIFYVSPFQDVEGGYTFRFDIREDHIGIWIDYQAGNQGLIATLTGPRQALTNGGLLRAMLRRPFGGRRVLALIHWQAFKLWRKGVRFRRRPEPPAQEVSR